MVAVLVVGLVTSGSYAVGGTATSVAADASTALDRISPFGGAVSSVEGWSAYGRTGPDADGDRLPDAWERAGETPGGAALPGADPYHKDLYVQVNYGADVERLTARERAALRRAWAAMPVENPDGTPGVRLHLDDTAPYGGHLAETPTFTRTAKAPTRYYTARHLGARLCRYHQVTLGDVRIDGAVGYGSAPGYGSVVDGKRVRSFGGDADSRRVHVLTHELLHNVLGPLPDGSHHTERGWLAPNVSARDDFLPQSLADRLSEEGFAESTYYHRSVCSGAADDSDGVSPVPTVPPSFPVTIPGVAAVAARVRGSGDPDDADARQSGLLRR